MNTRVCAFAAASVVLSACGASESIDYGNAMSAKGDYSELQRARSTQPLQLATCEFTVNTINCQADASVFNNEEAFDPYGAYDNDPRLRRENSSLIGEVVTNAVPTTRIFGGKRLYPSEKASWEVRSPHGYPLTVVLGGIFRYQGNSVPFLVARHVRTPPMVVKFDLPLVKWEVAFSAVDGYETKIRYKYTLGCAFVDDDAANWGYTPGAHLAVIQGDAPVSFHKPSSDFTELLAVSGRPIELSGGEVFGDVPSGTIAGPGYYSINSSGQLISGPRSSAAD